MTMEYWRNDTDRENVNTRYDTYPSVILSTTNSHRLVGNRTRVSVMTSRKHVERWAKKGKTTCIVPLRIKVVLGEN